MFALVDLFLVGGVLAVLSRSRASSSSGLPPRQTVVQQLHGEVVTLELVTIGGGFYLTEPAASAYLAMERAAAAQGVTLHLNSAWRSNAEQKVLHDDYVAGRRKAIAAPPGWSKHEAGRAVDVETDGATNAAFAWLNGNAGRFGFKRTVSTEPWHWEHA